MMLYNFYSFISHCIKIMFLQGCFCPLYVHIQVIKHKVKFSLLTIDTVDVMVARHSNVFYYKMKAVMGKINLHCKSSFKCIQMLTLS